MADYVIAKEDLYIAPGVLAHREGTQVPAENAEVWGDRVAKPGTKAADKASEAAKAS